MKLFRKLLLPFFVVFTFGANAQNYPVASLKASLAYYSDKQDKMWGYGIKQEYEFGITRRFSLTAGAAFHSFEKYETFPVDTSFLLPLSPSYSPGGFYNQNRVIRLVSLPLTANYFFIRNENMTLNFGTGTALQYETSNGLYYSRYRQKPDGTADMGPYYGYNDYTKGNDAIVPDFMLLTAMLGVTKSISKQFGISAYVNYMLLLDGNFAYRKHIYEMGLGVFVKSGKNFRKH